MNKFSRNEQKCIIAEHRPVDEWLMDIKSKVVYKSLILMVAFRCVRGQH